MPSRCRIVACRSWTWTDELLRENLALQGSVREAHPELCWIYLSGKQAEEVSRSRYSKKNPKGLAERRAILRLYCRNLDRSLEDAKEDTILRAAGEDDWLDAIALAVTARGVSKGEVRSLPTKPAADEFGIAMEIVGVEQPHS